MLGRRRLFEAFVRVWGNAAPLGSATRNKAFLLVGWLIAVGRGAYIGAVASAVLIGILLVQTGRRPAQVSAPADHWASQAESQPGAAPRKTAEDVTSTVDSPSNSIRPAPAAVDVSRVSSISTPAPLPPPSIDRGEAQPVLHAPDKIGDLLTDKPLRNESHLIHAAQKALVKLGYAVKADGAEEGETRRALRDFERAHGLAPTTEISPGLVSQLVAAVRAGRLKR
jgi:Putative peptidoglycan binding domain